MIDADDFDISAPAPVRAGQSLPESYRMFEREDLQEPVGSWAWRESMAMLAPLVRSRLEGASSFSTYRGATADEDSRLPPGPLPIGANLHLDLIDYESLLATADPWERAYFRALEDGASPSSAWKLTGESRTTHWRNRRRRDAA